MDAIAIATVVNALATVVLVAITAFYARSTAKILDQMREQSRVLSVAAQISANAALTTVSLNPKGEMPFDRIRELLRQLEAIDGSS